MSNEPKRKPTPRQGLREPKAKSLGLKVPPSLRMPHEDLFPAPQSVDDTGYARDTGINSEPEPETNRFNNDTGSKTTPSAESNRFTSNTGNAGRPEAKQNQFAIEPGIKTEPSAKPNQSNLDTGLVLAPEAFRPVIKPTPEAKLNRSKHNTSPFLPPVVEATPYREPKTKFFKTPNEVSDVVQARLTDEEFNLYFRLFRLSHGHRQATCFVGYTALARALNWSLSKVKRVMPRLLASGYVRLVDTYNGQELKGSVYEVFTGAIYEPVAIPDPSNSDTGSEVEPNKHDDDHDSKFNPHQREVMRIYQELTGNPWTKADTAQYERLLDFTADEIENHMRLINNRASARIGSFAFFVTGIEKEIAEGGQQGGWSLEKQYEGLAKELAGSFVGGDLAPSEMIARLKARCLRDGVTWNNDLANKVLGL